MDNCLRLKTIVVGDQGVGKTSLGIRFAHGTFSEHYIPTIGAAFVQKQVKVEDRNISFQVWDTAGQERFRSLIPMYTRDAAVSLVVYDICNRASYLNVRFWLDETKNNAPEDVRIYFVGNKSDQDDRRQVQKEEAKRFANDRGHGYFETSAKTGENVSDMFNKIGKDVIIDYQKYPKDHEPNLTLRTEDRPPKKKCC